MSIKAGFQAASTCRRILMMRPLATSACWVSTRLGAPRAAEHISPKRLAPVTAIAIGDQVGIGFGQAGSEPTPGSKPV